MGRAPLTLVDSYSCRIAGLQSDDRSSLMAAAAAAAEAEADADAEAEADAADAAAAAAAAGESLSSMCES